MDTLPPCPKCQSVYVYESDHLLICPECAYEWNPDLETEKETESGESKEDVITDAHGTVLNDGDDVIVIKDLPVKGSPKPIKAGTKVKIGRASCRERVKSEVGERDGKEQRK